MSNTTPGSYQSGGGLSPFYAEELHENRLYLFSTKSTWKKAYVRLEQGQDIDFAVAD